MRYLALAVAALASLVSAQTTTTAAVTVPTGGAGRPNAIFAPTAGDHVKAPGTFLIKWTADASIPSVNIFLRKNNGNQFDSDNLGALATNVPNKGTYNWEVKSSLVAGADYAIELTWGAQTTDESQYSAVFSVDSSATAPASTDTTSAAPTSTGTTNGTSSTTTTGSAGSKSTTTKGSSSTTTDANPSNTGVASPGAGTALVSSPLALIFSVIAALAYLQ